MDNRLVRVPVSLLLDRKQTASTKVVWMALRLDPAASPASLEAHTGVSRPTILQALDLITPNDRTPGGPKVQVPAALLAQRKVGAQAKVLYGLLQATPDFRAQRGRFTYTALAILTQLAPNTLKRSMADLVGAGWVQTTQSSRLSPIHFTLGSPELRRGLAEAAIARRRLKRARFGGEAIMQEYLSLLIDSDAYTDNARPGFLVNPQTGERMELDRYYPPDVAFEFNGAQHYAATGRFSQAEADAQRLRDLIKAGICVHRGIHLVIIHEEDLSLQSMASKVSKIMPVRRDLQGREPLIDLLEDASITYRAEAAAARKSVG